MTGLADKLDLARSTQVEGGDAASALSIFEKIQLQQEVIAKALPAGMDAGRFVRMVLTEVRRTPKLATCDPSTLIGAMMLAAQTGLEPGGPLGQSFLIPRWSSRNKVNECQFQIGYKGYVQLAARCSVTVEARTVRDGDEFEWEYGSHGELRHRPVIDSEAPAYAWWAMGHYPDDRFPPFVVIGRNVANQARDASASGTKGPWGTHYDAMAQKTALLRLAAYLPLSTDVSLAIAADGAVVRDDVTIEAAAQAVADEPHELPAPEPGDDLPDDSDGPTDSELDPELPLEGDPS